MSAKEPSKQLGLFPKAPPSAAEVEAKERLRAAVRFCSKVDRWKGEHPDVSPLDGLRLAVRREAAFELAHTVPGEPTSEVAPLFRDDLGVTDDDIVAARKLE